MPERHARRVVAGLIVAVFAFAVQQTSVVPAVHDIQASLHAAKEWASWLVTVYLIVATAATPAMGRLGDLYGRRRLLAVGLAVFGVASLGAALAPSVIVLLIFRAIQGVGGSVYPLALAIARENAPEGQASQVVSALTAGFGLGTAVGFVGGGALSEFVTWRAIFACGAAIMAAGLALVLRLVPAAGERAGGGFDRLGAALLTIAAITLLSGLTLVVSSGRRSPLTIGALVIAAVMAGLWIARERRAVDPLLDLGIFRLRKVSMVNLATVGLGWALFGGYLLIPDVMRADPRRAGYGASLGSVAIGLVLLPMAVGQTAMASAATAVVRRTSARAVFAAGLSLIAGGTAILAWTRSNALVVGVCALLLGVGAGASLQAGSLVVTQSVAADVAAASAAANSTVRRLAGGVGGQVNLIVLASYASSASAVPAFAGFTVSYLIACGMCVLGVAVVAAGG